MMSSIFPHELFDIVLDFLHDDKRALGRISLVSASWAISARHHLFHKLEVKTLSEVYDFIIGDNRHHLSPYVHVLTIRFTRSEPMFSFLLDQYASLLQEFTNLQKLDMPSMRLRYGIIEHLHFRALRTLHLSYNWIGNSEVVGEARELNSLWRVLSLFSHVEDLHLHSTKSILLHNPSEPPIDFTSKCSVDALTVDDRISGVITRLLVPTIDLPNVQTLSVVAPLQLYMPSLAQFLNMVPRVRDLTIHLPAKGSPDNPEPEWKLLRLGGILPLLSAFTLRFAPDGWGVEDRILVPIEILSTARESLSLQAISIEPVLSQRVWLNKSTSALTDIDWARVANYLLQFKDLKTVTIRVRHRSHMSTYRTQVVKIPPHIKRLVEEGFSTFHSQVKLVVSDT